MTCVCVRETGLWWMDGFLSGLDGRGVWIETRGCGTGEGWDSGDTDVKRKATREAPVRYLSRNTRWWSEDQVKLSVRERACQVHPSWKLKEEHVPCAESRFPASDWGSYWSSGLDSVLFFVELCRRRRKIRQKYTLIRLLLYYIRVNWSHWP